MTAFLTQDFPALAAGLLASIACALVGAFLVLRRMSLMGDAISHAVLPGIIGAFLMHWYLEQRGVGANFSLLVFAGAVAIGIVTTALTEAIHRLGRVESGASMGVVFTVLFALGVLMLERAGGRTIHLDADCVLYGAMENVLWTAPPTSLSQVVRGEGFGDFPRQVTTLAIVLALNLVIIVALFKELRVAAFDPGLAKAQGVNPSAMHYLLMTLVAITTVASFEAVGSILVVAMLIVPGLCGHLLSNRLAPMLWISVVVAALAAVTGYGAAARLNVNSAGMIGVMLGLFLAVIATGVALRRRRSSHDAPAISDAAPPASTERPA